MKKTPQKGWGRQVPDIKARLWDMRFSKGLIGRARDIASGRHLFFSRHEIDSGLVPDWFANPFAGGIDARGLKTAHWSQISDFGAGDIKGVWELSRFGWVYPLLAAFQLAGDENFAETFWDLLEDWAAHNPPNTGVHWKCGQEIAIRCFALTCAWFLLRNARASTRERCELVREILFESGRRIEVNIEYALSQKNNHGVSEAAGLFTVGVLFGRQPWLDKGRDLLESQARELIYEDGSFSQHSVNYHRLMLQVYLWALQLGRTNGVLFSDELVGRVRTAGLWLQALCDLQAGRCPNLGANDGALIFPVTPCDYLDHRPTIQAVGLLVDNRPWLPEGAWDGLAWFLGRRDGGSVGNDSESVSRWVGGTVGNDSESVSRWVGGTVRRSDGQTVRPSDRPTDQRFFPEGGYAVMEHGGGKMVFRCPGGYRHRPGQCDLLHVDVFHGGINVLRDGGSFSYNCDQPWQEYFKSVAAHNTVQFDDHDQMPKLSRFLYGKWPRPEVAMERGLVRAAYRDWRGCRHQRTVMAQDGGYRIIDRISGYTAKAVLRWRLAPELDWRLEGDTCFCEQVSLVIATGNGMESMRITQGWESLYYQERTGVPVLEVVLGRAAGDVVTEIFLGT